MDELILLLLKNEIYFTSILPTCNAGACMMHACMIDAGPYGDRLMDREHCSDFQILYIHGIESIKDPIQGQSSAN